MRGELLSSQMEDHRQIAATQKPQKRVGVKRRSSNAMKTLIYLLFGLLSALYLFNPGAGFIELIPDNIPGVGNLDEVFFSAILLKCLAHFGFDVARIGRKKDVELEE